MGVAETCRKGVVVVIFGGIGCWGADAMAQYSTTFTPPSNTYIVPGAGYGTGFGGGLAMQQQMGAIAQQMNANQQMLWRLQQQIQILSAELRKKDDEIARLRRRLAE